MLNRTVRQSPVSAAPACLAYVLPRLGELLFVAVFLGVIFTGPRLLNGDGDLGRHITIGTYILTARQIPTADIFSHTMPGEPLTPHEWLAQVFFALAHQWMGLNGVVLLCALLIALVVALVYQQAARRSGWVLLPVGLAVAAAAAAAIHWLARPHLWTMLLLLLWVDALGRLRRGEAKVLWRFPLLMLAWVNLHGAFVAGFMVWLIEGVGMAWEWLFNRPPEIGRSWWKGWLWVGGSALAVSFLNPVGWRVWETSLGYVRNRYLVDHTFEYFSPNFHTSGAWPFLLLLLLSIGLLGLGWMRLRPADVWMLAGWTGMSLYSARNIPLYALIAAPIMAEGIANAVANAAAAGATRPFLKAVGSGQKAEGSGLLEGWLQREARLLSVERGLRGHLWAVGSVLSIAVLLALGIRLDFKAAGNAFDPQVFPVEAVNWIETHPLPGKGFNHFPWGGYLLYRLWPGGQVFIDGQTDFYGEALTRQYEQVISLDEGWQAVLAQYEVEWLLIPRQSLLARTLALDANWQIAYQDDVAILFTASRRASKSLFTHPTSHFPLSTSHFLPSSHGAT